MSSTPLQNELPAHAATAISAPSANKRSNGGARLGERHHTVRGALRAFFAANPGAELTRREMAEKFFRSVKTIDIALARMKADGELEPVHAWRLPASKRSDA